MFYFKHWLKLCDIPHTVQCFKDSGYWCAMKSSMDPRVFQRGRSFGGTGYICKKLVNISYKNVDINCDRVSTIQILKNHKPILTVIVYIDQIVGDFNATLPHKSSLGLKWYK